MEYLRLGRHFYSRASSIFYIIIKLAESAILEILIDRDTFHVQFPQRYSSTQFRSVYNQIGPAH